MKEQIKHKEESGIREPFGKGIYIHHKVIQSMPRLSPSGRGERRKDGFQGGRT